MTAPEAFYWVLGTAVAIFAVCTLVDSVLEWIDRWRAYRWERWSRQNLRAPDKDAA